ncbi:hypothetical protein O6H91_10G024800 [Diphasiastrum complanatum]|uniref:Uncharacterized protein n=1 Tax=Diphasiastrum complanatum TaxID=34168 RepID=A0ACC2CF38_DIPCM|nr:hypothetical protein O6H91_10G024800 [Diphasiastrum complanatum]
MGKQSRRDSAKTAKFLAVILNFFAGLQCAFAASTYIVGDIAGWGLGNDYSAWAKKYPFAVGDSIVFNYSPTHTVLQVSQADYQACNINSPLKSYKSGKDTVTLTDPSSYFVCGTPGHCQSGMKLAIDVTGSTPSTPYTPPIPSNPTPTIPSNPTLPPPLNPAPLTPSNPTPTTPAHPAPPTPSIPTNPAPPLTPSIPSNPAPLTPSSPTNPAPPTPSRPTPTIPSTPAPPNPSSPSNPASPTPSNPTSPTTPSNPAPLTPSNPTSGGTPSTRKPPSTPVESSSAMLLQSGTALTLLTLFAVAMPFLQ